LLLFGAAAGRAEENTQTRSHSFLEGQGIQRGSIGNRAARYQDLGTLAETGERKKPTRGAAQQKLSGTQAAAANTDFWFYDADLILFSDFDNDGYFYGLDLAFDVDTNFVSATVYAVIYLSYQGGPWNEYVETADFDIFGASADDEYVVVSELVSGYPTGDYDVLIDLYDTYDGAFVASFGPDESSQLSFVPLEDIGRDTPFAPQIVVVDNGGGGSLEWFSLLLLLGAVGVARRRRA
jgi:hypothetical protein